MSEYEWIWVLVVVDVVVVGDVMEVAVVMVSLVISFSDNDEFSSSPVLIVVVPSSSIISETKSWKGSVKKLQLINFSNFFHNVLLLDCFLSILFLFNREFWILSDITLLHIQEEDSFIIYVPIDLLIQNWPMDEYWID